MKDFVIYCRIHQQRMEEEILRYSDVSVKQIYNVDFDPVRTGEFDRTHLAVILKKNTDERTVVVVPLTRNTLGVGERKENIGKIQNLPSNLRNDNSYVVFTEVRSVNCSRIFSLKDNNMKVDCVISDELFIEILALCSNELASIMPVEDRMNFHYSRYIESVMEQLVNAAYHIKRLLANNASETEINYHRLNVQELQSSTGISFEQHLKQVDRDNGIVEIINMCLDNKLVERIQEHTG